MKCEALHLRDFYPSLSPYSGDPIVRTYIPLSRASLGLQDKKRPSLIICPGGAYEWCSEGESEPIALNFLSLGFNVFSIHYSVKPHRFPAQMLEVAALMELIYKNSDEWGCDTSKIAIMGFSAGGHLAAQYSTMFDCREVRDVFIDSKPVNATLLCYPVISAKKGLAHAGSFENLVGTYPLSPVKEDYFSCDKQVSFNTPPTFLWHTSVDECVPVGNTLAYADELSKHNIPFELHIYPYGAHGLSTADNMAIDNIDDKSSHANAWIASAKKWLTLTFGL